MEENIEENLKLGDGKMQEDCEYSDISSNNTLIVRNTDDANQTAHTRTCLSCFKRIDKLYYFSWEFMEFCNVVCVSKFQGLNFRCTFCSQFINNTLFGKFYMKVEKMFKFFCSNNCMDRYKSIVKICSYCQQIIPGTSFAVNSSDSPLKEIPFCSESCSHKFIDIVQPPKIPQSAICSVCKNSSITITLKHNGLIYFCGKRCLTAYSFVKLGPVAEQCIICQNYFSGTVIEKFTVHYDKVNLYFCSTICQNIYMLLNQTIVSCNWCQNKRYSFGMIRKFSKSSPKIYMCSVNCFTLYECSNFARMSSNVPLAPFANNQIFEDNTLNRIQVNCSKELMYPKKPVDQRNVATMCCIPKAEKAVSAQYALSNKATQTDKVNLILPTPVPIYVPSPVLMFALPVPMPVPFFLPIPVPVFIPVTTKSFVNVTKEIETINNRVPNDPYEAELLKIADIIAEEKVCDVHSDSPDENETNKENIFEEESELDGNLVIETMGAKRLYEEFDKSKSGTKKRKCDNAISLDYLLGVNALRRWMKNKSLHEKVETNNIFKKDISQLLSNDLCFVLDSFIKELRKPDGSEYAPDTIYYLCLGIQYYLNENSRSDNIFLDKPYRQFCDTLNQFAEKFHSLYHQDSQFIITRVEEEHLWQTRQLGPYSPHILLFTLVYFNTKYYRCSTLEQHLGISFFHILKLRRKKGKSKIVLLRFHPTKSKDTKHAYEQYANDAVQNRCPVKLYEFYLSKCPESVKTSNSLFYLQPEQYCTPESPVWYMNNLMSKEVLVQMINRVKMVKEINIAFVSNN